MENIQNQANRMLESFAGGQRVDGARLRMETTPRRLPTIALGLDALGLEAPTTQLRIPSDVPPQPASPTTPLASMCLSPAPPTTPLSLASPRPDSNQEGAEFLGGKSERPDIGEMLDMLQDSGMGRDGERNR